MCVFVCVCAPCVARVCVCVHRVSCVCVHRVSCVCVGVWVGCVCGRVCVVFLFVVWLCGVCCVCVGVCVCVCVCVCLYVCNTGTLRVPPSCRAVQHPPHGCG